MTATADRAVRIAIDKKYVVVEVLENGITKERDRINPDMRSKRIGMAKLVGVDDGTLLSWIDDTRKVASQGNLQPQVFPIAKAAHGGGDLMIRRLDERDDLAQRQALVVPDVLTETIPGVSNDLLIKWTDSEALCCLDVDYHDAGRPSPHESWLRARVTADLAPRPYAWHFSKSGGLHLFYVRADPFDADELASVAALCWRRIDPSATVELKTGVRGPAAGEKQKEDKTVYYSPGDTQDTTALLVGWVQRSAADDAARDEWLSGEGMEIGRRYDHTKCPIMPTPGYTSTGDPVVVMESGIFCHRCEGEGRSLGCRRVGYAPYGAIIGGESAGELGEMLRNICHWGHARTILLNKYGFTESLARKAYRAALKAYHHGTQKSLLVPLAFDSSTEDFTRLNETWYNLKDHAPYISTRLNTIIAKLPAVCTLDDNDKPKADEALVTVLMNPHDHSAKGFPKIDAIYGMRMKRVHLFDTNDPAVVEMFLPEIRAAGGRYMPQYIPPTRRNVEEAWGMIEEIAPGIDRALVTLIMGAIGTAQETLLGMHPRIFVEGATGTAKTTTPQIAAGILGCVSSDFSYNSDEYRWKQAMYAAVKEGGLVLLNEIVKDCERASRGRPVPIREPFDPLLNVTPTTKIGVMHVGPRPYGRLPAFVLTEPQLPLSLRDEKQIARRLWHWKLHGEKNWTPSFIKAGVSSPLLIRTASSAVANACNMIASDVIDRFFSRPTSWEEIAAAHGCQRLSESDAFDDLTPFLLELFRLTCSAPKIDNKRLATRYPNGYKKISRNNDTQPGEEDALTSIYSMFADGRGTDWLTARRLTEKDWAGVLKAGGQHVNLDLTNDGVNVFIRFRVGPPANPSKVNEQIVDPTNWEVRS